VEIGKPKESEANALENTVCKGWVKSGWKAKEDVLQKTRKECSMP
jgi:hypothetical protein